MEIILLEAVLATQTATELEKKGLESLMKQTHIRQLHHRRDAIVFVGTEKSGIKGQTIQIKHPDSFKIRTSY